ncbi:MAG: SCO family protein [Bacteroidales bacterium]|nr:SCO family protein [Bacteroidales bacterium]
MKKFLLLILSCSLFFSMQAQYIENSEMIGIYEKLDTVLPADARFYTEQGELVSLVSLIDKPSVLVLVYYTCPGICSPLLDGIADVITRMDLELGEDYQILTVSFNPEETPELARDKKVNYVKQVKKEINEEAWMWLTGDSANIHTLTNSVGYHFIKQGEDFVHAAAIIAISPEAKVTRYLYGTYFLPFDLKMAIVEASKGRSGPTINKVLQYCFSYDPEGKSYVFNITKVTATLILFFVAVFFIYLLFSKRKTFTKKFK